jgi:hypothetical protein
MSYTVKEVNGKFNIFEKDSQILIELECDENKARDMCRKLNLGSGFNGWTPIFIAEKLKVMIDGI